MYKKILAFVLSSMMLAQSVSAASFADFVSTKIPTSVKTNVGGDMLFDYGKVKEDIANNIPGEIVTNLDAQAAVTGTGNYNDVVTSTGNTFDFKVTLDMSPVRDEMQTMYGNAIAVITAAEPNETVRNNLIGQFDNSIIKGTFEVTVTIDDRLGSFDLTTCTLNQGGTTFVSNGVTQPDPSQQVYVFTFEVKPGVTVGTLVASRAVELADLSMEATATATTKRTSLGVTAELTSARTTLYSEDDITHQEIPFGFIDYTSNADTATVMVRSSSTGRDGLDLEDEEPVTPGVTEAPKAYLVLTDSNVDVPVEDRNGEYFVNVDAVEVPEKEGFVFDGLYLDPVFTDSASGEIQIYEDTYLYPKYINVTAPSQFISDEHISYIVGYPDGEVKPNNNITREEVVAALYRLLKPEYRATLDTDNCNFPDVQEGRWSYESIAAFASAGFVVGDTEGRFNPANPITRAEFVTIINKFATTLPKHSGSHFTDIADHWAEESIISSAIDWSWVTGYEDNTFRPNSRITRAEAVTIINKMLVRYGDVDSDLATQWPDLKKTDWYYGAMIEATTAHSYTRNADGWSETWTK